MSTKWSLGYMDPQTETVQATPAAAHFSPVPMAPQDRWNPGEVDDNWGVAPF